MITQPYSDIDSFLAKPLKLRHGCVIPFNTFSIFSSIHVSLYFYISCNLFFIHASLLFYRTCHIFFIYAHLSIVLHSISFFSHLLMLLCSVIEYTPSIMNCCSKKVSRLCLCKTTVPKYHAKIKHYLRHEIRCAMTLVAFSELFPVMASGRATSGNCCK